MLYLIEFILRLMESTKAFCIVQNSKMKKNVKTFAIDAGKSMLVKCFNIVWLGRILEIARIFPKKQRVKL